MRARALFDFASVPRRKRTLLLAIIVIGSVLAFCCLHLFVIQSPIVEGDSMSPTLINGERCVLWKFIFHLRSPHRGDLVALQLPGEHTLTVKRVVALPDESVQIRDRRVYVNERPLPEPYLPVGVHTDPGHLTGHLYRVSPNCYFVLGDNRAHSVDSRYFGAVENSAIVGLIQ